MYKIHKRKLFPNKSEYVLPHASKVIAFCEDGTGALCIWYKFHTDAVNVSEPRRFSIFGTGHAIPDEYEYVGTAVCDGYVWHLHEVVKPSTQLHPDCQKAWDRGLTDYPKEEHARDCEKCQKYQKTDTELEGGFVGDHLREDS